MKTEETYLCDVSPLMLYNVAYECIIFSLETVCSKVLLMRHQQAELQ